MLMLCHVMLCYAYAMLCYAMLCVDFTMPPDLHGWRSYFFFRMADLVDVGLKTESECSEKNLKNLQILKNLQKYSEFFRNPHGLKNIQVLKNSGGSEEFADF